MNSNDFREFGKSAIDFLADYLDNIRDRDVLPSVEPGYLQALLPSEAPETSEDWKTVMDDMKKFIMPGITHWQSPNFHAYYPTATSFPSIVGDMLSAGLGVIGFSWICSPACTELETIVMDWLAKMLDLPKEFLHSHKGPGGGVIQGSASEAILVAVLAAREQTVKRVQAENPAMSESEIRGKLIIYSSDQSNSAIEKSSILSAVPIKLLKADENCCLTGETFQTAMEEDVKSGKIPIICIATLGTTGTCAFDKIDELGPICKRNKIWLHVDAAYAGGAFVCPEYRHLMKGMEYVDSLNFNLHKWMLVNFDCSAMWVKNGDHLVDSFNVDRIYLKHKYQGKTTIPDYRHWQVQLGRKFRALKVWMVLRTFGVEKIRQHIRSHVALAQRFAKYVENDNRFEIVTEQRFGLVVFRLKGDNELTKTLLERLTDKKQIYMIAATVRNKYVIRFVVCGMDPQEGDVDYAWNLIRDETNQMLTKSCLIEPMSKVNDGKIEKINEHIKNGLSVIQESEKIK